MLVPKGSLLVTVPLGEPGDHGWFRLDDVDGWTALFTSAGFFVEEQEAYELTGEGWRPAPSFDPQGVGYGDRGPAASAVLCTELSPDRLRRPGDAGRPRTHRQAADARAAAPRLSGIVPGTWPRPRRARPFVTAMVLRHAAISVPPCERPGTIGARHVATSARDMLLGCTPAGADRAYTAAVDFSLTDEQREIQALAREVAGTEIAPHAADWDREHRFPASSSRSSASSA